MYFVNQFSIVKGCKVHPRSGTGVITSAYSSRLKMSSAHERSGLAEFGVRVFRGDFVKGDSKGVLCSGMATPLKILRLYSPIRTDGTLSGTKSSRWTSPDGRLATKRIMLFKGNVPSNSHYLSPGTWKPIGYLAIFFVPGQGRGRVGGL